jgi:hypothetical protein
MTHIRTRPVLVAMLLAVSATATLAAPPSDAPRITDCRIGWDNQYKVGHWTPMWIDVSGALPVATRIEVTVPDADGVETTFTATPTADAARAQDSSRHGEPPVAAGQPLSVLLYVKIGRIRSEVDIALVAEGKQLDRATFQPADAAGGGRILPGLPSTAELLVTLGPIDLAEAFPNRETASGELAFRNVHLQRVDELPTEWFGYEGIDTLVLATGDLELCRRLAADRKRQAAIDQWVKLGGRMIVLCGRHAPELLAEGQPLAALVPGTFVQTVRLTQTSPLEHFAQSEVPIARGGAQGEVVAAQLRDVVGRIDAFAGGKPTDLPLVVRAPHGMGELGFVAVDFDAAPLDDWQGRIAFLRTLLRPYTVMGELGNVPQTLVTLGYNDLSGALRQRLGRSFPSVRTITFPVIALLVIGYLVLLGPGDYLLVRRFARHRWVAWVTFPLLVVLASSGAYWLASAHRGNVSVNQLELVDVDLTTGTVRGTYWAVLYSPEAKRYDLSLDVRPLSGRQAREHQTLLSWLGLPGSGLGGMHATSVELGIISDGYRFAPKLDALEEVPLLSSSTKSLLARWTVPAIAAPRAHSAEAAASATNAEDSASHSSIEPLVSAQLAEDDEGFLVGSLTNQTGQTLNDVRLLYRGWAYRLGDLPNGRSMSVDQSTSTIQVKTLIARDAYGPGGGAEGQPFLADRAQARELLSVMMFYQAAGGHGFAKLLDQYQSYCDFSRLLDLGRAVLVAGGGTPGSTLVDQTTGKPLRANDDQGNVVYRFILPVETANSR